MSAPFRIAPPPPVSLDVCLAREDIERRSLRSTQRVARRQWPHDEARRKSHCAPAVAALQRAWANTDAARALAEGPPPAQGPAAGEVPSSPDPCPGQCDDWIPDYPPQDDEHAEGDDNQDSTEYPEYPEDEQRD